MYRKTSRRRQLIARTLVYSLMTTSVVIIVAILMLVVLGYSFNRKDGKLEQGGLLQFASVPSGMYVTLDGESLPTRTPSKASVDAKSHFVRMDLKGYRTWGKTITVEAGGIGWLSYARMIPTDIKTESLRTFPRIDSSLASPDRRWIAINEDASTPEVTLANIESSTPKYTTVSIPDDILSKPQTDAPSSYSLESWGGGDDYLLVKRMYDTDKTEWVVVDRATPQKSINLTATFAVNATAVQFGGKGGRDMYVRTDDIVRKVNLDDKTLSVPLVENVEEFSVYNENTLVYVTKLDGNEINERHVGYREDGMEKPETIFSYGPEVEGVHVSLGSYFGKTYVAVSRGTTFEVFSGTLPRGTTKAKLTRIVTVTTPALSERLSISRNGRFAVAQQANSYTTYDIELKKTDTTTFSKPASEPRKLQWIDDYMIWSDRGNMLRFFEFDGANQHDIMPILEGQAATLSGDEKYIYSIAPAKDGVVLQRAKLILN